MTAAKISFDGHIKQCQEAITIYGFLVRSGYSADFGLRFVWVASVSALDHYISQLIIEKSTEHFSNGMTMSSRLLNEGVPLSSILALRSAHPAQATVEFRKIVTQTVRFRTFQKADDVADGLAFIWTEEHKWNKISERLGLANKFAKRKLNSIGNRRDLIVHNADFDEATKSIRACNLHDAQQSMNYIIDLVEVIDGLIP